jgi:glycosyltransferase involved in cell wall biosynthesis
VACLLKKPDEISKGVVTFTTQERDRLIFSSNDIANSINKLREKYVIGLHHNWHDYGFRYNSFFDFSMAGEGDLSDKSTPLVTLDACNFIPEEYKPSNGEKFWDVIYVTRAVYFKRVKLFLNTIKKLFQEGKRYRVLLVVCIPPEDRDPSNVVQEYMNLFTSEERKYISFIPLEHDYPFCLDSKTVAFLYRSSKVFVHFANDERRCRVVGNAAATEMPIVCMPDPASIVPKYLQKEPYVYVVQNEDYATSIKKAVEEYDQKNDLSEISKYFSVRNTREELKKQLSVYLKIDKEKVLDSSFNYKNLDIRLGRHHSISYGPNKVDMSIQSFCNVLGSEKLLSFAWDTEVEDLEKEISLKCQI